MSLNAVSCKNCGGAVRAVVGERSPSCLFCGSPALEERVLELVIEQPKVAIEFAVDEPRAREVFKRFATSSYWYPSDLRTATLTLNRLHLPSWVWSGTIESHFAALVPARSSSGKCPITGKEHLELHGVLVPSSTAIRRGELAAISPFDTALSAPFDPDHANEPFELGRLTRSAARQAAIDAMQAKHAGAIGKRISASRIRTACKFKDVHGEPLLVPVYIGAYNRKGRLYRVVINGQTGRLTGEAPTSWCKVALAFGVSLLFLGLFALFLLTLLGGGVGALMVM